VAGSGQLRADPATELDELVDARLLLTRHSSGAGAAGPLYNLWRAPFGRRTAGVGSGTFHKQQRRESWGSDLPRRDVLKKPAYVPPVIVTLPVTPSFAKGGSYAGHGNNGVGNGLDSQPPGDPPINDGPGTGPGNQGGAH